MQFNSFKELENWPYILKVNLTLSIFFLLLALLFIALVLFLRLRKNQKEAYRAKFDLKLIDFFNRFLFDDDFQKATELGDFKLKHLRTPYDYKLTIKQILIFDENLKYDTNPPEISNSKLMALVNFEFTCFEKAINETIEWEKTNLI